LGLARWLIDPANPLAARVAVNRIWQTLFGTGIVKTAEDFGVQGEPPSHPELLDWLAVEFINPTDDGRRMTEGGKQTIGGEQLATDHARSGAHDSNPSSVIRHPPKAWDIK